MLNQTFSRKRMALKAAGRRLLSKTKTFLAYLYQLSLMFTVGIKSTRHPTMGDASDKKASFYTVAIIFIHFLILVWLAIESPSTAYVKEEKYHSSRTLGETFDKDHSHDEMRSSSDPSPLQFDAVPTGNKETMAVWREVVGRQVLSSMAPQRVARMGTRIQGTVRNDEGFQSSRGMAGAEDIAGVSSASPTTTHSIFPITLALSQSRFNPFFGISQDMVEVLNNSTSVANEKEGRAILLPPNPPTALKNLATQLREEQRRVSVRAAVEKAVASKRLNGNRMTDADAWALEATLLAAQQSVLLHSMGPSSGDAEESGYAEEIRKLLTHAPPADVLVLDVRLAFGGDHQVAKKKGGSGGDGFRSLSSVPTQHLSSLLNAMVPPSPDEEAICYVIYRTVKAMHRWNRILFVPASDTVSGALLAKRTKGSAGKEDADGRSGDVFHYRARCERQYMHEDGGGDVADGGSGGGADGGVNGGDTDAALGFKKDDFIGPSALEQLSEAMLEAHRRLLPPSFAASSSSSPPFHVYGGGGGGLVSSHTHPTEYRIGTHRASRHHHDAPHDEGCLETDEEGGGSSLLSSSSSSSSSPSSSPPHRGAIIRRPLIISTRVEAVPLGSLLKEDEGGDGGGDTDQRQQLYGHTGLYFPEDIVVFQSPRLLPASSPAEVVGRHTSFDRFRFTIVHNLAIRRAIPLLMLVFQCDASSLALSKDGHGTYWLCLPSPFSASTVFDASSSKRSVILVDAHSRSVRAMRK